MQRHFGGGTGRRTYAAAFALVAVVLVLVYAAYRPTSQRNAVRWVRFGQKQWRSTEPRLLRVRQRLIWRMQCLSSLPERHTANSTIDMRCTCQTYYNSIEWPASLATARHAPCFACRPASRCSAAASATPRDACGTSWMMRRTRRLPRMTTGMLAASRRPPTRRRRPRSKPARMSRSWKTRSRTC